MTADLMFRIGGDSTAAERAATRAEIAMRKYQVAVRQANKEMETDLAQRVAKEAALREKQERQIAEVAAAERTQALTVMRARREMTEDFARRAHDVAALQDKQAQAAEDAARRQTAAYSRVGTGLLAFGATVGVALGLAGKSAMDWESSWAGVEKTVDGANENMEQSLRDLTKVLPATHEEIAAVAAAAGALGIETPNVVKFTRTMIDLGEATDDLDAQEAATGVAQFMNVVGTAEKDVDRLASTIVDLGNNGASTEGEILSMGQRLAAAGKIAHLSEADILGFASALTSVGIEAEAGGSAFSRVFISIDDAVKTGGENLETFAAVAGMSASEFSRAFREDAAGAIIAFVEGLGRADASGQSLTGTLDALELSDLRVRNALLSAAGAGDLMRESIDLGNQAWEENSALLEEVARRYETTESKVKIARNQLNDAAIDIGQNLLPVIASLASGVANAAGFFADLPGPVQSTLVALGGLAATGALTVGALLKIRSGLAGMSDLMKDAPGLAKATTLGLKGLGGIAIAGGVVVGLQQITNALHDIFDPSFDTSKLRADLIRLGATGKATGTLLEIGGDGLDSLRESFEKFEGKTFIDEDFFGFAANSFVEQVEQIDSALAELVNGGDIEAAQVALQRLGEDFAPDWGVSVEEAVARITDSLPAYSEALKTAQVDAEGLTGAQGQLAAGADGLPGTFDDVKAGADGLFGSMDDLTGGMSGAGDAAADLSPLARDLADDLGLTDEAASDAADALDNLDSTLGGLVDKWLGSEEATDALAQSWADLAEEIAGATESGEGWSFSLDGQTDAARRNRDVMRGLTDDAVAVIETWDKSKLTSEQFADKIDALKQSFIDQGVEMGYAREDVERYAGVFDQIPTSLPLDVPITVHQQELIDAQAETGVLAGALKALEEPATITVEDEAARETGEAWRNDAGHFFGDETVYADVDDTKARTKGTAWRNDAAHFFSDHTITPTVDDKGARVEGERWLKDATESYFVPHTVDADLDDSVAREDADEWLSDATYRYFIPHTVFVDEDDAVARAEGERWLTDAKGHYFVPHTVKADADDSAAREKAWGWKAFADQMFADRTLNVDVDVDIPWDDLAWLESHLPGGTGDGRGAPEFATGGIIPATPGGTLIRVAEAGEDEAVIPTGRLKDMVMGAYDLGAVAQAKRSSVMDGAAMGTAIYQVPTSQGAAGTPLGSSGALGGQVINNYRTLHSTIMNPVTEPDTVSLGRQLDQAAATL